MVPLVTDGYDVVPMHVADHAAGEIQVDPPHHLVGGDHVHAARQPADDVDAQLIGVVLLVAVAERQRA